MGRITKRKARLVALGNLEWETVRDTYAPTVNAKTINLMLALSAQERLILYGLDVTGAFLNADIGETVYIELPDRLRPNERTGMAPKEDPVWIEESSKGLLRRHGSSPPRSRIQALSSRPMSLPQDHLGAKDHLLCSRGRLRNRSDTPRSD